MADELEVETETVADGPDSTTDGTPEPFGASVMRRLHEDCGLLLQQYDEMMPFLEHDAVKKRLHKKLETLVQELDEIEKDFGSHYKDLPGLAGAEMGDTTGLEGEEAPLEDAPVDDLPTDDLPPEEEGLDDGQDGAIADDAAVPGAEDDTPLEEPAPEEVVEGMAKDPEEVIEGEEEEVKPGDMGEKSMPDVKDIRTKYAKQPKVAKAGVKTCGKCAKSLEKDAKALCPKCGKEGCSCNEKGVKKVGKKDAVPETTDQIPGHGYAAETLDNQVKGVAAEAAKLLKDLSADDADLDDEKRLKAYHVAHKVKDILGKFRTSKKENESEEWTAKLKHEKSAPGVGDEALEPELKGWHKTVDDAAKYLESVSREKAFGRKHRDVAKALHKAMEDAGMKSLPEADGVPVEEEEKGLNNSEETLLKKSLRVQLDKEERLERRLAELNGLLAAR
jgi:hypothetical protein